MKLPVRACMALCILSLTILPGCATSTTQSGPVKKERYFWPPLPDTPRVEFLHAYTGPDSFTTGEASLLSQFLGEGERIAILNMPTAIVSDGMGKVYLTDQKSRAVIYFDLKAKTAGTFGGETSESILNRGTGIGLDAEGNLYVGDNYHKKIFVMNKSGAVIAVYDIAKHIESIGGLAIDKARKRIVAPDIKNHKIILLGLDGSYIDSVGKRGSGDLEFNYPIAVAVDREGVIHVADSMNARIVRLTPDLKFINKFGKRGDGIGEMAVIKGVAVDNEGHIYVTDGKMNKITIYSAQGDTLLNFGGTYIAGPGASIGPGGFQTPMGIFIDQNDTIYVADMMNSRFHVYQYVTEQYLTENPIEGKILYGPVKDIEAVKDKTPVLDKK